MLYKEKLKILREKNNLTQQNIANKLNIAKARYCQYENEYEIIPLKHLITISDFYQTSIDYIFSFSNNEHYKEEKTNINQFKSGERLKEIRKENKLTQENLANKLNVARSIISKYEKGEFLIATHTLYTLCKYFNISADYLLGKIDSPKYLK